MNHDEIIFNIVLALLIISALANIIFVVRLTTEKIIRNEGLDQYECRLCGDDVGAQEIYSHTCSNCMCSQDSQGRPWWIRKRVSIIN